MAGEIEDEHILPPVHQLGDPGERQRQAVQAAHRQAARPVAVAAGEYQRAPRGVVAAGEDAARFPRLAAEDEVAVERDRDDIGVDHALALRLERRQRGGEAPLLGKLEGGGAVPLQVRTQIEARGHRRGVGA